MPEAQSLLDLMQIRAHNRQLLDAINGNLGTALGCKKPTGGELTAQPAIIAFVPRKINPKWLPESQIIPKRLEGPGGLWCAVDVVEGGQAEQEDPIEPDYSELGDRLRGWDEQVWAGSQVAHWVNKEEGRYSMGTLGAFTRGRDNGRLGFLTNQHVGVKEGQRLYHPVPWGTHIGTTQRVIEFVQDEDWYGPLADEPATWVRADCAFVELSDSFSRQDVNPHLMGVGELGALEKISIENMSIIGQKVLRVGRTTGLRRGKVVSFGYEYRDEENVTVYTDLLIIGTEGKAFSTHGDSGSLIVTDDEDHNPIGLLWGGWQEKLRTGYGQENWTYGISLSRVLNALKIDLVRSL